MCIFFFSGSPRRQRSCSNGFAAGKNASLSCERSGLAAAGGRALKTTIQVVFATDSLMLSLAILLPGCSRPTTNKVKKEDTHLRIFSFSWLPKLDSNQRHRD